MIKTLEDLAKLTTIKTSTLEKISSCLEYIVVDNVSEEKMLSTDDAFMDLDIGIGILTISIVDDSINYYFKPSSTLEKGLINAINNNENILENKLTNSINSHIYKVYKDMF